MMHKWKRKSDDDLKNRRGSTDEEDNDQEEEKGEQGVRTVLPNLPEFRPDVDMKDPKFQKGLVFPDVATFKAVVRQYAIKTLQDFFLQEK